MDIEMKDKIKKAIRRALEIKTIIFIILTSVCLVYFRQCYQTNQVITFGMKDSVFLTLLMIMKFWIMSVCLFLIYENRQLLKIIIQKNDTIVQQNQTIEKLLNKTLNSIEESAEAILEQNEENFDQLMKSSKNTKEILLDRSDRIA